MSKYIDMLKENPLITCIVMQGDEIIFSSSSSGVKPLLDFYQLYSSSKENLIVIDRIMGRGAVLLAILIQSTELYTPVISEAGLDLAHEYNLTVHYEELVPYIVNRSKDGRCPIESSVLDIHDIHEGYQIIINTLSNLENKR